MDRRESQCNAHDRFLIYASRISAHAALAPWEGRNSLDAAVSAYLNVSMLRQQLKPTYRVHTALVGRDWAPNSAYPTLDILESGSHECHSYSRLLATTVSAGRGRSVIVCVKSLLLSYHRYLVRAPTTAEVKEAVPRVRACLE